MSVCIPAFHSERFIGETISSVIQQSFDDFELIVTDNSADDRTLETVKQFEDDRIRVLRTPTAIGAEGNWNRAVEEAQGHYVKLLCADDLLYPTCLERQVAALDAHPRAAFTAAKRDVVDPSGRVLLHARGLSGLVGEVEPDVALRRVVRSGSNPFGEPVSVLMRNSARRSTGQFVGQRPYVIDVDMWCRLLGAGTVVAVPESVGAFRVSLQSWSYRLASQQLGQVRSLFAELRDIHPTVIKNRDLMFGTVRAFALTTLRRLEYARVRRMKRSS